MDDKEQLNEISKLLAATQDLTVETSVIVSNLQDSLLALELRIRRWKWLEKTWETTDLHKKRG